MKKTLALIAFMAVAPLTCVNAQTFSDLGRSALESSKRALENSSFSLANTYAVNIKKTVNFTDGSVFSGSDVNGKRVGFMNYGSGKYCRGQFDENWRKTGLCIDDFGDGTWYYGHYSHGVEDGEGSIYADGEYHDVTFDMGVMTSAVQVSSPKYDKVEYESSLQQAALQSANYINQMSYEAGRATSTSSSSQSRSSSWSNLRSSSAACGVCHGTGRCITCNGKGYYVSLGIGSGKHLCPSCNQTGRCRSCNGTGKR